MKAWVYDDIGRHFINVGTKDIVSSEQFKLFESENHQNLRGISGDARLERYLLTQKPAKEAVPSLVVTTGADAVVEPRTRPVGMPESALEAASGVAELCAACGCMTHEGACAFV